MSFSYEVESPTGHMYNYSENGEVLFSRATAKCCTFFFKDVPVLFVKEKMLLEGSNFFNWP